MPTKKTQKRDVDLLDGATYQDVGRLAESLALTLSEDPDDIAQLLALCHIFTFKREIVEREIFLCAVEKACAPFSPSFDDAIRTDKAGALAKVQKAA